MAHRRPSLPSSFSLSAPCILLCSINSAVRSLRTPLGWNPILYGVVYPLRDPADGTGETLVSGKLPVLACDGLESRLACPLSLRALSVDCELPLSLRSIGAVAARCGKLAPVGETTDTGLGASVATTAAGVAAAASRPSLDALAGANALLPLAGCGGGLGVLLASILESLLTLGAKGSASGELALKLFGRECLLP